METLLEKVQNVEADLADRMAKIEQGHASRMSNLRDGEATVLEDVRARAQERATAIIEERVAAAEAELNEMKQDETRSVAAVHEQAQKQRANAVERAVTLFNDTYTT